MTDHPGAIQTQQEATQNPAGGPWRDGFVAGFIGARHESDAEFYRYSGPSVQVSAQGDWVIVETDPYEGSAMINRETVPALIEMLRDILKTTTASVDA